MDKTEEAKREAIRQRLRQRHASNPLPPLTAQQILTLRMLFQRSSPVPVMPPEHGGPVLPDRE